jgi:hypothetical protein
MPWVRIKGLPGRIVALNARQMPLHWRNRYGHAPLMLETLVDANRLTAGPPTGSA